MFFHHHVKKVFAYSSFLIFSSFLHAGEDKLTDNLLPQAHSHLAAIQILHLDTPIPQEVRSILAFDKEINQFSPKEDLGAGVMRAFLIEDQVYVMVGKRFGQFWKAGVGGKVEAEDKTLRVAIQRELDEEYFHQVPLTSTTHFFSTTPHIAGGLMEKEDDIFSKGWGPYCTFFALETTYSLADLEASLKPLNINGGFYTALNTLFAKFKNPFEDMSPENRQATAENLLNIRHEFLEAKGFLDVPTEVEKALTALASDGNASLNMTGVQFAQQFIHPWSEYSEFKLVKLEDLPNIDGPLFKAEAQALDTLKEHLSSYRGI